MALKKYCKCGKLIDATMSRCEDCEVIYREKELSRQKRYDKTKRDKDSVKFYNSTMWKNTRAYVLDRFNYIDVYQYYINKVLVPADTVHHIVELKDNWDRRYDVSNLIPLSDSTHMMIHGEYNKSGQCREAMQRQLIELMVRWERDKGNTL